MESPIYYAIYFVNKQYIRSFSNIIDQRILKSKDEAKFFKHLLQDDYLVSQLSTDIRLMIYKLRSNTRLYSKQDFKNYFPIPEDMNKNLCSVDKGQILEQCLVALSQIIPKSLFGCNHNIRIFRKNIKLIVYSMRRQCFLPSKMLKNWTYDLPPWNEMSCDVALKVLVQITNWINRYLLAAMISLNFYVTTCKIDTDDNKLCFFRKNKWQSFYDKNISRMLFIKFMKKCSSKSFNEISKNNNSKRKFSKNYIPKLYLILKPKNDCRPIVHYKKELNFSEKCKIKEKLNFLKILSGPGQKRLDNQFEVLHKNWLKRNKPKLYFIKSDLSNAFGCVNRKKLLKILSERQQLLQNTEKCMIRKQKFALWHREIVSELKKPFLVRTGSSVYEWLEGLVQGYKYSPALADLYYSYMDEIYFSTQLTKNDTLRVFSRTVDDYLYITDSLEDAQIFLESLSNYRNVNYSKTVVNFAHPNIQSSNQITYLGYKYDTSNLQVSRAENVYSGQLCFKISFISAIENLGKFIENRIGQSAIQISSHIFNLNYNNEELIWQHIFVTLCLSANKFCTILAMLCDEKEMLNYMLIYKKIVTVKLCNGIIETLLKTKSNSTDFVYCINHFRYLSFQALLICAKFTKRCNVLTPFINQELMKSNCIFGKWREHSSRMNKDGTSRVKAMKEVCKRPDLALIIQGFNTLPNGFECFNDKVFYK